MKGEIAITSLRFNPAFIQLFVAYAKAMQELGYGVVPVLDAKYFEYPDVVAAAGTSHPVELDATTSCTHAIFLNPAPNNSELAERLKRASVRILYIYHEPWQLTLSYLTGEGLRATIKALVAHRLTAPVLKRSNVVIVVSQNGLRQYRRSDAKYNPNVTYIPLLFDDELVDPTQDLWRGKRFCGYVGKLCRAHGFDHFVSFMRQAFEKNSAVRFLIASQIPLPKWITEDRVIRKNLDKLELRCGRPLSTEEINRCYSECFCIWNGYRRSTQSGVLPKAFMFGTPVIASRTGAFPEFVQSGETGRFVDPHDFGSILAAVEDFQGRIQTYSRNCRKSFQSIFYYRAQLARIQNVLDSVACSVPNAFGEVDRANTGAL